ncbi:pectate lyase [Niabella sp. CC-SYL272]|uniref:pectate lyase n=1 Tax=Niabella agricola TaxID=2891571 RepID=UPI001F31C6DB|nr:pectate lyase [Niabella agricola]MCF3109694.1 pectate lyase [Niabella agricola]
MKFFLLLVLAMPVMACSKSNTPVPGKDPDPVTTGAPTPVSETGYAFPGAEGFGKYATGGRSGVVIEVTNLNDAGTGSLREAVKGTAAKIVIFRIAGTIRLLSKLNIGANTTIAGQTAPGDGICVADHPVVISGDNVIIRFMRFRMGDRYQNKGMVDGSGGDDALGNLGNKHIIIDHCSVSWSSDEALTIYRGDSLTLQWNIVSEPLNYSYHFETGDADYEQHGYGGIWGSKHGSFHHNLIAHCRNRMPRFAGVSTYTPATVGAELADFRNNLIYNWGINNIYGGEGGYYNMVNNYLKPGPSTTSRKTQIVAIDSSDQYPYAQYYLNGNYITSSAANTSNNWLGASMKSGKLSDTVKAKRATPFPVETIVTHTAAEAYTLVLQKAGCVKPQRDTLDARIISDVQNSTGRIIDVQGGFPHGTEFALTVNAWPALQTGTAPADTDKDGMPDDWEKAKGLNPNDISDGKKYTLSTGYTNVEVYINSLATGLY